jgi:two-component system, cell cycle sensor histidine kinase and response regulator CckA
MRTVELNELVSNVERMLRPVIGERIQLVTKLSGEPLRVLVDAGQLEQVLVDLVINARDAIAETGRVELTTGRQSMPARELQDGQGLAPGEYAWLEVKGDGAGPSDDARRRFEPLLTTEARGAGVGLEISTIRIVRQHDGAIHVDSCDEQGTLVRVLLPLANAASAADVQAVSGVVPVAPATYRVLVVEDEPQVRAIAARALTNAGFEVLQAANGALGLALLEAQRVPFDVVVTDVIMPALSGPDLARAARALDQTLGIVFMSGFPEPLHDAHATDFAGAAFLAKPFSPRALVQAVHDCIERRSATLREYG